MKLSYFLPVLLLSCTKETPTPTREVTFHLDNIHITTRATLAEASMTDLWVWEGTTLLSHQTSSDTDFGSPKVTLTYGQHDLTFVASSSDDQTWQAGTWSTTHLVDVFGKAQAFTVDGNTQSSMSVELSRRSSRVKFQTTDLVPTSVSKCHITVANHKSLDAALTGGSAYTHDAMVSITSKQGSTFSVFVNVLTSSATTEEDTDVMIEFLDANDAPLYHYERTIAMQPNRLVTLKGDYFTSASNSITLSSTDYEQVTQDLFADPLPLRQAQHRLSPL